MNIARLTLPVFLIVLFLTMLPAFAQSGFNAEVTGTLYQAMFHDESLDIQGDYAYIGLYGMLAVVDISDPDNPVVVGYFDLSIPFSRTDNLIVEGDYAYWIVGNDLVIVDVSDPEAPVDVSRSQHGGTEGLQLVGDLLYMTTRTRLIIVDVSDRANPETLFYSNSLFEDAHCMSVTGTTVCVGLADDETGIVFLDSSDPTNPVIINHYNPGWRVHDIEIIGDYAVLAVGSDGLRFINISDPLNPSLIRPYNSGHSYTDIQLVGELLYAYYEYDSFHILDISSLTNIIELFDLGEDWSVQNCVVQDGFAHVLVGDQSGRKPAGYRILDVHDPANAFFRSVIDPPNVAAADVEAGYLYVLDQSPAYGNMRIVDVSDPTSPHEVGHFDLSPADGYDVKVVGDLAYVSATHSILYVLDVSNPVEPVQLSLTGGRGYRLTVDDGYLYMGNHDGLLIYDLSDPTTPSLLTEFDLEGETNGIAAADGMVYLSTRYHGVHIIDASDPMLPELVATIDSWWEPTDLAYANGFVYVTHHNQYGDYSGIRVLDVRDADNPTVAAYYDFEASASSVVIENGFAYVGIGYQYSDTEWASEVRILDIRDPFVIHEVGYSDTESGVLSIAVENGYAYALDNYNEIPTKPMLSVVDCNEAISDPNDVELTLVPTSSTEIPASGGSFSYEIHAQSHLDFIVDPAFLFTKVKYEESWLYRPIQFEDRFTLRPNEISIYEVEQFVPDFAPPGNYILYAFLGKSQFLHPQIVEPLPFSKSETGTGSAEIADWSSTCQRNTMHRSVTESLPRTWSMLPVYPNPFNPTATVTITLPETAELTVAVYNVAGQQVATLHNGSIAAGTHALSFDASSLASGLYFVRATVPGQLDHTQKVMLVR